MKERVAEKSAHFKRCVAEAEARGRAEERAAIVAWLQMYATTPASDDFKSAASTIAFGITQVAHRPKRERS